MSAREWKPGDVAAWDIDGHVEVIFFRNGGQDFDQPGWQTAQDGEGYPTDDQLRPLVVLDPEDREQVERLARGVQAERGGVLVDIVRHLQAALREFANPKPPKPAEPTGLGAVVEDAEGERWVRHEHDSGRLDKRHAWYPAGYVSGGVRIKYADIDAVRVLSEGIQ